jgi:hypothetical protein
MSYAMPIEATNKALYATVVNGFYTDSVYNPVSNTMTNVSYFPLVPSAVVEASNTANTLSESLTCASKNPAYKCMGPNDCPGPKSKCALCRENRCV